VTFGTLQDALAWATDRLSSAEIHFGHGTDNAADEAAFLVLEALDLPIDRLGPALARPLNSEEQQRVVQLIDRRIETRMPAPYLVGRAYIGRYRFASDARALVPRSFIGELLAAGIGADMPLPFVANPDISSILELGTGSGCLAILAALAFPDAVVDAIDISAAALDLARTNVDAYGLAGRINLVEGDLYAPVAGGRYDLIIANPPYVDAGAMAALPEEYRHEPALGLAGGADGLDLVRAIVAGAGRHLHPEGGLLCEIGRGQGRLTEAFPDTAFLWLDSAESRGEMFWLDAGNCPN
jgi:ribosomal protein L3 glutamine methyltransferase